MWASQIPEDGFPPLLIKILCICKSDIVPEKEKWIFSSAKSLLSIFLCISMGYTPSLQNKRLCYPRHPKHHPKKFPPSVSKIFLHNIHPELPWSSQCAPCLNSQLILFWMETTHIHRQFRLPRAPSYPTLSCSSGPLGEVVGWRFWSASRWHCRTELCSAHGGLSAAGGLSLSERRARARKEMCWLAFWWWTGQTLKAITVMDITNITAVN